METWKQRERGATRSWVCLRAASPSCSGDVPCRRAHFLSTCGQEPTGALCSLPWHFLPPAAGHSGEGWLPAAFAAVLTKGPERRGLSMPCPRGSPLFSISGHLPAGTSYALTSLHHSNPGLARAERGTWPRAPFWSSPPTNKVSGLGPDHCFSNRWHNLMNSSQNTNTAYKYRHKPRSLVPRRPHRHPGSTLAQTFPGLVPSAVRLRSPWVPLCSKGLGVSAGQEGSPDSAQRTLLGGRPAGLEGLGGKHQRRSDSPSGKQRRKGTGRKGTGSGGE